MSLLRRYTRFSEVLTAIRRWNMPPVLITRPGNVTFVTLLPFCGSMICIAVAGGLVVPGTVNTRLSAVLTVMPAVAVVPLMSDEAANDGLTPSVTEITHTPEPDATYTLSVLGLTFSVLMLIPGSGDGMMAI